MSEVGGLAYKFSEVQSPSLKASSCKTSSTVNRVRFDLLSDILADFFFHRTVPKLIKEVYSKGSTSLIVLSWIKG